jgi:hypothetical protein
LTEDSDTILESHGRAGLHPGPELFAVRANV